MDRISLTQRVLGGLVLLSLVAIFLPWLFDLSQVTNQDEARINEIPDMPENVKQIIYRLDKPGVRFEEEDTQPAQTSVKSITAINVPPMDSATQSAEGEAPASRVLDGATTVWMIQIGTFSKKSNALKLRDKLRKAQYPTYLDEYQNSNGDTLWRLKVGPEMSVKNAEDQRAKLERDTGLKGLLVQH